MLSRYSTSVLKALPGKLDIKRHSPSILYITISIRIKWVKKNDILIACSKRPNSQFFLFLLLNHNSTNKVRVQRSGIQSKGAKIRKRYNQVPHLTQDTNGKMTNSHLDTTNESQEVSPFPPGDHKAHINRRAQRHSKPKREKHKRSTKEVPP